MAWEALAAKVETEGMSNLREVFAKQFPQRRSQELEPVLRTHLERHMAAPPVSLWSNEDYWFAHVIRDIPPSVAEKLLVQYLEKLRVRPLFVQAALYVSTDRTR